MQEQLHSTGATRPAVLRNENFLKMLQAMRRSWIPANPELLQRLQLGLEAGRYEDDIEGLVRELKGDVSLFTYCVRELSEMARRENPASCQLIHPVEALRQAGVAEIKRILEQSHHDLQVRRFSRMKRYQLSRLQESLTSAGVTEALAEAQDVDPDLGFSSALLRQLGLTMIAWNYPRLYTRAVAELSGGTSLDEVLSRVLGFSPLLLGITLARQWNLAPEIRVALGDTRGIRDLEPEVVAEAERVGGVLNHICRVGEALARANSVEEYPTAQHDWSFAKQEIERTLGDQGFLVLEQRIKEACRHCMEALPEVLREEGAGRIARRAQAKQYQASSLFAQNTAIAACPDKVQAQLRGLYHRLHPEQIDKDLIRVLARNIIPASGFPRGCIYAYAPTEQKLWPRLAIGGGRPEDYPLVDCSPLTTHEQLVARAFAGSEPLLDEELWSDGSGVSIAISYGSAPPVGVLVVMPSKGFFERDRPRAFEMVRAFRQTLMDCLKLP